MKTILLSLFCFCFLYCASHPRETFSLASIGDDKGTVLHKLGNPSRTYQKNDTTRWVYKFFEDGENIEREIWFNNGQVVYIDSIKRDLKHRATTPSDFEEIK